MHPRISFVITLLVFFVMLGAGLALGLQRSAQRAIVPGRRARHSLLHVYTTPGKPQHNGGVPMRRGEPTWVRAMRATRESPLLQTELERYQGTDVQDRVHLLPPRLRDPLQAVTLSRMQAATERRANKPCFSIYLTVESKTLESICAAQSPFCFRLW